MPSARSSVEALSFSGVCPCSLPLPEQRYGGHPPAAGCPSRLSSTQSRPWGRQIPHSRRSHPVQSHSKYCEAVTGSGALGQGDGNMRLDNRKLYPAQQGHNLQINVDMFGAGTQSTPRSTCICKRNMPQAGICTSAGADAHKGTNAQAHRAG